MGGPLAGGITELQPLKNILDLACGPGGWVLDVAFDLRQVEVAGVDISRSMVDFANMQARTQGLTNASCGVADITQPLDFLDETFDLVNARFLGGVLKGRYQWQHVATEARRLLRPGGMIRLVESDGLVVTTSPSLAHLQRSLNQSMHERGYGFSADGGMTLGITPVLPHLLYEAGFQQIRLTPFIFNGSNPDISGIDGAWVACLRLCEFTYTLALGQGLLDGMILTEEETVQKVINHMLMEIHDSNFACLTYGAMVCATRPE
jgi:ubiquinone/menaquinone biosynthesis C-methylase UbiE